jgi:hypothetical protein
MKTLNRDLPIPFLRPPDSDWWSNQVAAPAPLDRGQQLALLDPEGAAIDEFAKGGAAPSRLQKIAVGFLERLTAAVLGALRVEVRNVKVRVAVGGSEDGSETIPGEGLVSESFGGEKHGVLDGRNKQEDGARYGPNGICADREGGEEEGAGSVGRRVDENANGAEEARKSDPRSATGGAPKQRGSAGKPLSDGFVALEVAFQSFVLFEGRHGQNGGSGGGLLGAAWTAIFGSGTADKGAVSKHTQLGGLAIRLETGKEQQEKGSEQLAKKRRNVGGEECGSVGDTQNGHGKNEMGEGKSSGSEEGRGSIGRGEEDIGDGLMNRGVGSNLKEDEVKDGISESMEISQGGTSNPNPLSEAESRGKREVAQASSSPRIIDRRNILLPNEIDTVVRINKLGLDRLQVDARTLALELDVRDLAALASLASALNSTVPPSRSSSQVAESNAERGDDTQNKPCEAQQAAGDCERSGETERGVKEKKEAGSSTTEGQAEREERGHDAKGHHFRGHHFKGHHSKGKEEERPRGRGGGPSDAVLLWQKAFRLVKEQSHSTRLHGVLEAGAARRR